MKHLLNAKRKTILCAAVAATVLQVFQPQIRLHADNPITQTMYTADGAPLIYNDTFYLFTGHDEGNSGFFSMNNWRCFSSNDMRNWTDLGSPLAYTDFNWAKGEAWAGQSVEYGGKFYYYVTVTAKSGGRAIGVAVADKPEGPYRDALGKPLVGPVDGLQCIDPTVFVDDDGQAYMYWGNGKMWYVKLNKDMISYSGGQVSVDTKNGSFGGFYDEAPYLYKHSGVYYLIYAADALPQNVSYSTSKSPTGPWKYGGVIMKHGGNSTTNHPGIADFMGKTYLTYHSGILKGGGDYARSECVEELVWNPDGTIAQITRTEQGCKQIGTLNPYERVEAETICREEGIKTEKCSEGGQNICDVANNEYVKIAGVGFGDGASLFEASIASATSGGKIELRLDSLTGPVVGTCDIQGTGGWQKWKTVSCAVNNATGTHDLFLKFTGGGGLLFNIDWWKFSRAEEKAEPDVKQLVRLIKALSGAEPFTQDEKEATFDCNEDKKINILDIITLKEILINKGL